MRKVIWRFIGGVAAVLAVSSSAQAASVQLNFDGFDANPAGDYLEGGFSWQNSATYVEDDSLYLHDDSGGITLSTIKSVAGLRFDALDADISGYSRVYRSGKNKKPKNPDRMDKWLFKNNVTFDNYGFYGYRDGALVAAYEGAINGASALLAFGAEFQDLDTLVAKLLVPDALNILYDNIRRNTVFCNEWCAGFQIGRLALNTHEVSPVPLPAGLPLLAIGLGSVLALRRRRAHA